MIDFNGRKLVELKKDRALLEQTLRDAGAVINGNTVRCPFHDDRHASAGIYSANGSGFRYKCQVCNFGGSIVDVLARIEGCTPKDILRRLSGGNGRKAVQDRPRLTKQTEPIPQARRTVFPTLDSIKAMYGGKGEIVTHEWLYR